MQGDRTLVVVDGRARIERTSARATGGDASGGIALSVRNGGSGGRPRFTSLPLRPRPDGGEDRGQGGGPRFTGAVRPR